MKKQCFLSILMICNFLISSEFYQAVRNNDLRHVESLLLQSLTDGNVSSLVNIRNIPEETPLFYVKTPEMFWLLYRYGADLNAQDIFGHTALYNNVYAIAQITIEALRRMHMGDEGDEDRQNRIEIIEALLENGANPNIPGSFNVAPIELINLEDLIDDEDLQYVYELLSYYGREHALFNQEPVDLNQNPVDRNQAPADFTQEPVDLNYSFFTL